MSRVLFVASHRKDRAPGQRFRFEQYMAYLGANGFESKLSYLVSERDDAILYKPGHYLDKVGFTLRSRRIRAQDARRLDDFDIIFVQREALMTRSTSFERRAAKSRAKLIFDFDDSIWLSNVSEANRFFRWMKNPEKTPTLIELADVVFAGNRYLADYATRFNTNVEIVPTTIDTDEYRCVARPSGGEAARGREAVCIGWSGSITTIQHFELAIPFLRAIKHKYGHRVGFKVIGDENYRNEELGIVGQAWSRASEVRELCAIDIGIMPLPDDEWARGKCGLKGLQYMALGIPTVMSPVGVNSEIVDDGRNGFLALDREGWVEKISRLIEDAELRKALGVEARRTVVERYSVLSQRDDYLAHFLALLNA
ncbi:MAG: glycosyltransferase family 4 protein [Deltaproteobacteria bacterium]|nr:glycosyltransferase family 4 protein [Deltaproteobacteria bacterium]